MTRASHLAVVPDVADAEQDSDPRLTALRSRLDAGWRASQWDAFNHLLRVDPADRRAALSACRVSGCAKTTRSSHGLCSVCRRQFVASGSDDVEAWLGTAERTGRQRGLQGPDDLRCEVTRDDERCERTAARSDSLLCNLHDVSWRAFQRQGGTDRVAWLATVTPMPRLPDCLVGPCALQSETRVLCRSHYRRWYAAGQPEDVDAWAASQEPIHDGVTLWLGGLPALVVSEILYVLQKRDAEGNRFDVEPARTVARAVRQAAVTSLVDLPGPFSGSARPWFKYAVDTLTVLYADAEVERRKDIWDLRVLNLAAGRETGTKPLLVDFTPIRQRWLRDLAKRWIDTGSVNRADNVRISITAISHLSDAIALGPGAHDSTLLSRSEIDTFMDLVGGLTQSDGAALSNSTKGRYVTAAKLFLAHARNDDWLDHVPKGFAFNADDKFDRSEDYDEDDLVGRAVPEHVIAQLDNYVDLLDIGREIRPLGMALSCRLRRLAYRLLRDTGRRVSDLAALRLDCTEKKDDGWNLVYTNVKARRRGRRLPIDESLATEIIEVGNLVAAAFPHTTRDGLWLFPRPVRNPDGKVHIAASGLADWISRWVAAIPEGAILNDYPDEKGKVQPFDRTLIYPHAFRHAYAQRHADAGTSVDILRQLMDHRSVETTMIYYTVSQERRRAAVETVATLRLDRTGQRVGAVSVLAYEVQSVAVPYGNCQEPSNVAAGGKACPLRFQCAGCAHYRPDPSFLPAIEEHIHELLQNRETAIATGAADWVVDGLEQEIAAYRNISAKMLTDLADLSEEERSAIEQASTILRRARAAAAAADAESSRGPVLVQIGRRPPEEPA